MNKYRNVLKEPIPINSLQLPLTKNELTNYRKPLKNLLITNQIKKYTKRKRVKSAIQ